MIDHPNSGRVRVLVGEDEENLAQILSTFLRGRGHHVVCVGDGKAALQAVRDEAFDVALIDIVMPEMDGLEALKALRAEPDPPEVIIITGNGTVETAITAMKLGAYDYLAKPYRMAEIDVLVRRAWEKHQLARENRYLQARLSRVDSTPEVITQYAPMHSVLKLLERVATTDSPVLITGESGTGKTLLARAIHRLSARLGPMVEADSTVLSESVLDVELFGHERGAFSGAVARKAGLIELAVNGTLFVDEVGVLSSKLQSKLARALEHGSFFRVGGTQKVDIAVRLVTSSNHDLEEADARRPVPRGSVVSGECRDGGAAAASRALRRYSALGAALPHASWRSVGTGSHAGRDRADAAVHLARQHPRAAQRDRARGASRARRQRRDSCAGSAAGDGAGVVARRRRLDDDARGTRAPTH